MAYAKGLKHREDSMTESMRLLKYEDINGYGRLFGGKLMMWIDEVAGIAAIRHCGGEVTTACVENLTFKKGAYLGDMLVMTAKVVYVGRTSLEVRVDTWLEDHETGMRNIINTAYLTEVHVDRDGTPQEIEYGLVIESVSEQAEWQAAVTRKKERQTFRNRVFWPEG